jgi:hypothetical protein
MGPCAGLPKLNLQVMSLRNGTLHLQLLNIRVVGHAQLVSWITYNTIYISRSSPILWRNLWRELLYCTLLQHHGTQEGAMRRTTYQNITYKLCHFDTVHYTYSYYTYGWLVTRNLCRELRATVHKGRWLCIVHRAYYHNITLWFTSVLNIIIISLFVFLIILYTNIY